MPQLLPLEAAPEADAVSLRARASDISTEKSILTHGGGNASISLSWGLFSSALRKKNREVGLGMPVVVIASAIDMLGPSSARLSGNVN
jgi:hypothetical protein